MEYKHFTIKEAMTKIHEGRLYLPAIQRKFVWTHGQIERLFDSIMRDYPIGTFLFWMVEKDRFNEYAFSRTFMLLSLISPHLKFRQIQFHQDHIHPHSGFSKDKLKSLELDEERMADWQDKRDCLPNLQLLEGKENQSKNKKPFIEWLKEEFPNLDDRRVFLKTNRIPQETVSFDLMDFDAFFDARKSKLKEELAAILAVANQPVQA